MKKVFIIVFVLALLTIGATAALADEVTDQELLERHEEMLAAKEEWLDELVAEGVITQEEADEYLANMEERFEEAYCLTEDGWFGGRMFSDEDGWFGGMFNDDGERVFGGGMFQDDDTVRGAGRGMGCGFRFDD
ncbi:MAG: DUF2680 domain-containing protein [Eubacteriales bacterium]